MLDKLLTCAGSATLGIVLAMLALPPAVAQDPTRPNGAPAEALADEGTLSVELSGTAALDGIPNLSVTPAGVAFGLVDIGVQSDATVTLTHTGGPDSEPIVFAEALPFGKNEEDFSIGFEAGVPIGPGESLSLDIMFVPLSPGLKSGGVRVALEGDVAPLVILYEGTARYPLVAEIQSSTDALTFGQILPDGEASRTVTVSNIGDVEAPNLNVSSAQIDGTFAGSFQAEIQPLSIPPGESADIQVVFKDAAIGNKTAVLQLFHDGNNDTVSIELQGEVVEPAAVPVGFGWSAINADIKRGTGIDFGPDGKLYVAEMDGTIRVFNATRSGENNYDVDLLETITLVQDVPNHNDDGKPNGSVDERLVTGMLVTGTAQNPVIWVGSSDPRQGGGPSGNDTNLDTNSGMVHKLTKAGTGWQKQDVVRGLPRSEENHATNGMTFKDGKLIVMSGGFTNEGLASNNFAETSEYALSAAALEIDVAAIGNGTYDLPTLDDEDRDGAQDENDPFGGNEGKNQAMLVNGGPVQIYSSGLRNAYDVVLTQAGKLYTFDNGPNSGWGGAPGGGCGNGIDNGGGNGKDQLHLLEKDGYYGHPNPVRGNKDNTFNGNNPQSPIEGAANPEECDYRSSNDDGSLLSFFPSTNGITEYTAGNFASSMKGDLVVVSYGKTASRIELNDNGTAVTSSKVIADFGSDPAAQVPLDITAQGDGDVFPGTLWVVDNISKNLYVIEPDDY